MTTRVSVHAWWSVKRAWQVAAFGLTAAACGWWLLAPIYQPETTCSGGALSSGVSWDTCDAPTSMLSAGAWGYIAWLVVLPVVLAVLPLLARGPVGRVLALVSAAGLVVLVIVGGISFGLPFVPGAVCAVVGAVRRRVRGAGDIAAPGGGLAAA